MSKGVEKYRKLIWQYLYVICKNDKYKEKVREVIDSYGGAIDEISSPVLRYDLTYIKIILESGFPANELRNCLLVEKVARTFVIRDIPCEALFAEYFEVENYRLYELLKGADYKGTIDYKERENLKQKSIEQYISNYDFVEVQQLIDICYDIMEGVKTFNKIKL